MMRLVVVGYRRTPTTIGQELVWASPPSVACGHALLRPIGQELVLQENGFTAVGAGWLADALRRSSSLSELVLGGNPLGDAGIASLADALKVGRAEPSCYMLYMLLYAVTCCYMLLHVVTC